MTCLLALLSLFHFTAWQWRSNWILNLELRSFELFIFIEEFDWMERFGFMKRMKGVFVFCGGVFFFFPVLAVIQTCPGDFIALKTNSEDGWSADGWCLVSGAHKTVCGFREGLSSASDWWASVHATHALQDPQTGAWFCNPAAKCKITSYIYPISVFCDPVLHARYQTPLQTHPW